MLGILTILLCLFSVSFHELGHAWAMRTVGAPIKTISLLGFRIFNLPYFSWKYQPKWQTDPIDVQIHPFVFGAFVMSDSDRMEKLSVRDKAFVYGAGPLASIIYGLVMYCLVILTFKFSVASVILLLEVLGALGILWLLRKFFCRYLVPIVGMVVLTLVLRAVLFNPQEAATHMGGPIMIAQQFGGAYTQAAASNLELRMVFYLPALLSVLLGLTNAIPICPMDGGRIVAEYLTKVNKRAGDVFSNIGFVLFLLLMIASVGGDINLLIKGMIGLIR